MNCEAKSVHTNAKKGRRKFDRDTCGKKATWVIRKDGQEFYACDTHKTNGILVRKIS